MTLHMLCILRSTLIHQISVQRTSTPHYHLIIILAAAPSVYV